MTRRHIAHAREYRGRIIWHNERPGHALRWTAAGGLAADTLAGIKALIRAADGVGR